MREINTPYTQVDGEPISSGVEKVARSLAVIILIIGILIFAYKVIITIERYDDFKHDSNAVTSFLLPSLCDAIFYFIISLFAYAALVVLANMSLSAKARAFASRGDMGVRGHNNVPNYNDYAPQNHDGYQPQMPQQEVMSEVQYHNEPPQFPQDNMQPLEPQADEQPSYNNVYNVASAPRLYICPVCGNEVKDTMSKCPSCQTPLKFK